MRAMSFTYAHYCQNDWRIEGRQALLTSRGPAMVLTSKSQSFNDATTEPKEAASTA